MPDESCRKCGGSLSLVSKCFECKKPLEQLCTNCKNIIFDAVHACIDGKIKWSVPKNALTVNA